MLLYCVINYYAAALAPCPVSLLNTESTVAVYQFIKQLTKTQCFHQALIVASQQSIYLSARCRIGKSDTYTWIIDTFVSLLYPNFAMNLY